MVRWRLLENMKVVSQLIISEPDHGMYEAINKGILDEAKANAETIIAGMLNGTTDNDIVIDWQ